MSDTMALSVRLDNLPRKVAVPFRDLLQRGHVTEDVLTSVIDAGDLAGDHSRLLGFAIAFMQLRYSSVPIADVIKMAKAQGRRIRLDWSANRWRSEHDRLSRAEALSRLADESVSYDLSQYESHLPTSFPGYLIRSSRRLGMEGLRQRHCVASYHSQLVRQYCALAVVFIDRNRWTVQLGLTNDADHPLRISQIRTRLNRTPTHGERDAIHQALGIDEHAVHSIGRQPAPGARRVQRSYMDVLRCVLPVLRDHGVGSVDVTFDGSGDSGCIEGVSYDPADFRGAQIRVTVPVTAREFTDNQWLLVTDDRELSLDDAITEATDEYLEEVGVDWYNNDGGYGTLKIDVDEGTVSLEIDTRYTNVESAFDATRDIVTGEEI